MYYQEHCTQQESWNNFFLAQMLPAASSFQRLLFKEKVDTEWINPTREQKKNCRKQNLQREAGRTVFPHREHERDARQRFPRILPQLSGDLRDAPLKHCCVFHTESHSNVMTQPPKKHFNKPRATQAGIVCHPAGTNALATEPERTHIRVGDTRTTSVYQTQQVYQ